MAAISYAATLIGKHASVMRKQVFSASDSYNIRHLLGASPDSIVFTKSGAVDASAVGAPFVLTWDATSISVTFNGGAGVQLHDILVQRYHSLIK